jgi:hypothetical protein
MTKMLKENQATAPCTMSKVNLEVRVDEGTLFIKYTGTNSHSLQKRHFQRVDGKPGCDIEKDDIVLSGFPITEVDYENGRYKIRVDGKGQADRLKLFLSLPELKLEQPDTKKDIWVVNIGAESSYDDWYDSITETPSTDRSRVHRKVAVSS